MREIPILWPSVVSFFNDRGTANKLSSPDAIIEGMAKKVAKAM